MTENEAAEILENHNLWRRGSDAVQMAHPWELGQAIDFAVTTLKRSLARQEESEEAVRRG